MTDEESFLQMINVEGPIRLKLLYNPFFNRHSFLPCFPLITGKGVVRNRSPWGHKESPHGGSFFIQAGVHIGDDIRVLLGHKRVILKRCLFFLTMEQVERFPLQEAAS
jgi:hypothetical protein